MEVKKKKKAYYRGQNRTLIKYKSKQINKLYYLQITIVALDSYLAMIILIQLSDWFYGLKNSEITQKKIKQFYYDKTMVNVCNRCDVHMFFVEEIIEAVSSIEKRWPKMKD